MRTSTMLPPPSLPSRQLTRAQTKCCQKTHTHTSTETNAPANGSAKSMGGTHKRRWCVYERSRARPHIQIMSIIRDFLPCVPAQLTHGAEWEHKYRKINLIRSDHTLYCRCRPDAGTQKRRATHWKLLTAYNLFGVIHFVGSALQASEARIATALAWDTLCGYSENKYEVFSAAHAFSQCGNNAMANACDNCKISWH